MSTTQLTIFDTGQMPAHLADLNEAGNIAARDQINQLSFRGKVWRVKLDGKEDVVKNSEGDPVQSVQVIILDYNKARSRSYYAGGFEEGKTAPPTCWSKDGVAPDASVKEKQHATCAGCPQSVKGSKITESGKEVTACAQFKRMVVVPSTDPGFAPLVVKIPQTSMWDKDNSENEAKGFYAFDQFMDMLKRKGVNHTASVITKIKFDARTSYPKLVFGAPAWTPPEMKAAIMAQLADKAKLDALLNIADVPGAVAVAAPVPEEFEQPNPIHQPQAAAAPAPAKAATKPRPAPKAAPAPAAPAVDPDDKPAGFGPATTPTPAVAPAVAAPVAATTSVSPDLGNMLAGWDD